MPQLQPGRADVPEDMSLKSDAAVRLDPRVDKAYRAWEKVITTHLRDYYNHGSIYGSLTPASVLKKPAGFFKQWEAWAPDAELSYEAELARVNFSHASMYGDA